MTGEKLQDSPYAEDIRFIFDECQRIADMGRDVFKLLPKDDANFSLPHPSGQGMMLCGREASKRAAKLADEAGRRAGLTNRVSHQTLRKPVEELLVQRFVTERRELNRTQIDRFLSAAGKRAKVKCSDVTHFIPCTLMTEQEPEILHVGPVAFHSRASFRGMLLQRLRGYGNEPDEPNRKYVRQLMADAAWFYRQFDWVAEITIRGCDEGTSATLAERAATSALDCLHLLLRARYTNKMRVGGPALKRDRRAGVKMDSGGKLHPHWSSSWAGQVNFTKGWSKQLADPTFAHMLSLGGIALEALIDPDLSRPLSRRFLDAAQWFGEASRDDRGATRIVKYVTALERMVMTDEMDDITRVVSERIAALCCDRKTASDRQTWRDDASRIYDLRSRLVHGSMSPSDPDIGAGAWEAARIAEETLLNVLFALGVDGLKAEGVSTKRLAKWYGGVIATIDKVEAVTADEPAQVTT